MSRLEISGYVQIVIGIVGIALTIMTAPTLLDAVSQIGGGGGLPPEFAGVGGAIRIFAVLFLLLVLMFLILLGLSITLSTLLRALGSKHSFLASFCGIASIMASALTATLAVLGNSLWIPGFVGSLGLLLTSLFLCGDNEKREASMTVGVIFLILFLGTGAVNRMVHYTPDSSPTAANEL